MIEQRRKLCVRWKGLRDYHCTWREMRSFVDARDENTPDELWLLEHPSVFTLGQAGRREHIHFPGRIPVVESDRGGQVTYHGPGQLVLYTLLDLRRLNLGVRSLVSGIEQGVIDTLAQEDVVAHRQDGAPGVYVQGKKLAALGLRIRKRCCYHGVSMNVRMDLLPFTRIDPCGYVGQEVTQLADLNIDWSVHEAGTRVATHLAQALDLEPDFVG